MSVCKDNSDRGKAVACYHGWTDLLSQTIWVLLCCVTNRSEMAWLGKGALLCSLSRLLGVGVPERLHRGLDAGITKWPSEMTKVSS